MWYYLNIYLDLISSERKISPLLFLTLLMIHSLIRSRKSPTCYETIFRFIKEYTNCSLPLFSTKLTALTRFTPLSRGKGLPQQAGPHILPFAPIVVAGIA